MHSQEPSLSVIISAESELNNDANFGMQRPPNRGKIEMLVSISEYRKLLNDSISADEQIQNRLEYLEQLCGNIIKEELKQYYAKQRTS